MKILEHIQYHGMLIITPIKQWIINQRKIISLLCDLEFEARRPGDGPVAAFAFYAAKELVVNTQGKIKDDGYLFIMITEPWR